MQGEPFSGPNFKAPKGSALLERKAKRHAIELHEEREKAKVRKRDKVCRWPGCDCAKLKVRLEVAHLHNKGFGGDHGLKSTADQMILLCFLKHQGKPSLHSNELRIDPLTSRGTNGPVAFYAKDETGKWRHVATEKHIGVSEPRT